MELRKNNNRIRNSSGFTLLEVVFALVILAASLVVLLGLQSSAIRLSIRERNQQYALAMTRRILATLESSPELIEPRDSGGSAMELLEELRGQELPEGFQANDNLQARLTIAYWEAVPNLESDALLRVELTVAWGAEAIDAVQTVYFVPAEEDFDYE